MFDTKEDKAQLKKEIELVLKSKKNKKFRRIGAIFYIIKIGSMYIFALIGVLFVFDTFLMDLSLDEEYVCLPCVSETEYITIQNSTCEYDDYEEYCLKKVFEPICAELNT